MNKSRISGAVCVYALVVLSSTSHAAVINPINNLNIDGTLYDVTFHTGISFNALWDGNDDGVFGGGGSVFSSEPTFWNDSAGAALARDAVMSYLGTTGETTPTYDGFLVPYGSDKGTLSTGAEGILSMTDSANTSLVTDEAATRTYVDSASILGRPYASFQVVPVPAAVWLFGSGLLGLIGIARRKKLALKNPLFA
jgi:hypothetical protein